MKKLDKIMNKSKSYSKLLSSENIIEDDTCCNTPSIIPSYKYFNDQFNGLSIIFTKAECNEGDESLVEELETTESMYEASMSSKKSKLLKKLSITNPFNINISKTPKSDRNSLTHYKLSSQNFTINTCRYKDSPNTFSNNQEFDYALKEANKFISMKSFTQFSVLKICSNKKLAYTMKRNSKNLVRSLSNDRIIPSKNSNFSFCPSVIKPNLLENYKSDVGLVMNITKAENCLKNLERSMIYRITNTSRSTYSTMSNTIFTKSLKESI